MEKKKKKIEEKSNSNTEKNNSIKLERHEKKIEKTISLKKERLDLLSQLLIKYPRMTIGSLSKKYGTLNIRRLTDILNDVAEDALWYRARVARKEAQTNARMVNNVVHNTFSTKESNSTKPEKVRTIHKRRNKRNREIQMDQK